MERFTQEHVRQLADACTEHCLSICLPTHRAGSETRQDPIRLKNLLDEAADLLAKAGLPADEVKWRLEPARALLDDPAFWQQQSEGLALFLGAPGTFERFRVPMTLPEQVVMGPHFHVVPLLPLLDETGRFYILAASPGLVRLLEATEQTVREVTVPELPRDESEMMQFVDVDQQMQWHTQTSPQAMGGKRRAMFHGQGVGGDQSGDKMRKAEFATWVERAITRHLQGSRAPLVLATAEPFASIYRGVNKCENLLDETVLGNTDHMSPEQVRDRAWPIVEPHLSANRDLALARFEEAAKTGAREVDLEAVIPAAFQGRIHTLVVSSGDHVWGRFDEGNQKIEVHHREQPGDEDLVNLAAVLTAKTGGAIHALAREQMPLDKPVVALYRY